MKWIELGHRVSHCSSQCSIATQYKALAGNGGEGRCEEEGGAEEVEEEEPPVGEKVKASLLNLVFQPHVSSLLTTKQPDTS